MDTNTFPTLAQYTHDEQCEITDVWISFSVDPPTSRRYVSDIKLYPGRVDEMALEFFGYGGCCLLAGAMHAISGWPLLAFKRAVDGRVLHHVHMGVQTPAGEFLDITGPRSYASVRAEYGDGWTQTVTLEEAKSTGSILPDGWDAYCSPIVRETILFFADQLVSQVKRSCPNP